MTDEYTDLALFINGKWLAGGGRTTTEVINPATEKTLAMLPLASAGDLDTALYAAHESFPAWAAKPAHERSAIIRRAAQLMRERVDEISRIMTLEEGKPFSESKREVLISADIFDWYAEEGRRIYGRTIPARSIGVRQIVVREPIGPVAAFTPWNFPILTPARKIGGALASGCTCVLKAAEETPGSAIAIVRCFVDAQLPAGVLNLVFGVPSDVSEHLIQSPVVKKVSFTGSTAVGRLIGKLAADGPKPVSMELGGHAPVIVFDDANLDDVVVASMRKFSNAGQSCISPTRFYVQQSLYEDFISRMAEAANRLKVGPGMDATSGMGPLANARRIATMESLIGDAQACGARVVAGGKRGASPGFYWEPTVLADVPKTARIMNEEPFGPVMVVNSFETLDEAITEANRLPVGLAAYAFTSNAATVIALGDRIESGMVGINNYNISFEDTPFGGVKHSGWGSESGSEALDAYLTTKFIIQS